MELDDAFANAAHIPGGDLYPEKWAAAAAAFRAQTLCELDLVYGESPRQKLDLFHPPRLAKGLVVFVHGGYWLRFDKSFRRMPPNIREHKIRRGICNLNGRFCFELWCEVKIETRRRRRRQHKTQGKGDFPPLPQRIENSLFHDC